MKVTFQVRHEIDPHNPTGHTLTGELVDVGLPDGETAVLCGSNYTGWHIRHEESGVPIGGLYYITAAKAKNTVRAGCEKRKDTMASACLDARDNMDNYRRALWEAAERRAMEDGK